VKTPQKYPHWRYLKGGGWGYYTKPQVWGLSCHYSPKCGGWFVHHLDDALFTRLEDAKAAAEKYSSTRRIQRGFKNKK
jgi:hypothetical protein